MDIFDEEIIKLWKSLQDNNVQYILTGDFASTLHGYTGFTDNMDVWIKDSKANRKNLRKAFKEAEMGDYFMMDTIQFVPGWTEFKLNNGLRLDIITTMKGLEAFTFDDCLKMSTIAEIEEVKVPFLHINQLIANKKAVNRPKDQVDVIELEKIKELRKEMGLDQ